MGQINGFNIVFKTSEKLLAGTTSNTFNINPRVKESLTKEDTGTTRKIVTGYDSEFSVDGVMELNETEEKTKRLDREDVIDLVLAGKENEFVYGDTAPGSIVRKGKMIITSYSESTNADGEATYSLGCAVVSKLTKDTLPTV